MPEFLAEGQAINNLLKPDRIVIGTPASAKGDLAFSLLESLFKSCKIINTRNASAELGKLMANAMLAQRISSINSITPLTEKFPECCINEVASIVKADSRIGDKYLSPSPGFGGSCFDKDIKSLIHILDMNGETQSALYWQSVLNMNQH
jgi:UDPglucose 6-dehydrogenase